MQQMRKTESLQKQGRFPSNHRDAMTIGGIDCRTTNRAESPWKVNGLVECRYDLEQKCLVLSEHLVCHICIP